MWALTCGRRRSPGRAAAIVRRLCSRAAASTTSAGVVSSVTFTEAEASQRTSRTARRRAECSGTLRPVSTPWLEDACGLVDAFRAGELSPLEALDDCIAAIAKSSLNAFSFTDFERAREAAAKADVTLPFGGVPFGIKELEKVAGWPYSQASVIFKDRVAGHDDTSASRLRLTGAVFAGQTTAPEFGALNCTSSVLHGTTRNPWNLDRTPGGSSGGTAAAVVGGLLPIGTGSDGGGSIRGPAGFSGLFGLKATYGRIPKGPDGTIEPMTTVLGCLTRSARDTRGISMPAMGSTSATRSVCRGWRGGRTGLGTHDHLRQDGRHRRGPWHRPSPPRSRGGRRGVGRASRPRRPGSVSSASSPRCRHCVGPGRWRTCPPGSSTSTTPTPTGSTSSPLRSRRNCEARKSATRSSAPASIERYRRQLNGAMADLFDQAEFVFCSTHPDVAFNAEGPPPSTLPGRDLIKEIGFTRAIMNNAALTAPSNLNGSPAVNIPAGFVDGLPVGLQVLAGHHREQLLLDLALVAERETPWPLVAPGSPLAT